MTKVSKALFVVVIAALVASAQSVDLLTLVPPDAKFICGVNVQSAKTSPFGKHVLSQIGTSDQGMQQFVTSTGFDPTRDVNEIVSATSGTSDQPSILVVASGLFNTNSISAAAKNGGAATSTYADVMLFTHPAHNGTATVAIGFVNANLAVMGTLEAVQGAIDRVKSPAAANGQAAMLRSNNDAWFLSTGPITNFFVGKVADPNLGPALQGNLLKAVQQANGGVKFGDNVTVNAQAVADTPQNASALSDVVKFLAGLVQLNKDSNPQAQKFASLLDTLNVTVTGNTVALTLAIPEPSMEQLFVPPASAARHTRRADRVH